MKLVFWGAQKKKGGLKGKRGVGVGGGGGGGGGEGIRGKNAASNWYETRPHALQCFDKTIFTIGVERT